MSYILDALKKSEKERQKRTVPDPLEIHDYIAYDPKKQRPVLTYLTSAVVILGIGLLFYWMNPWQTKTTENPGISSDAKRVQPGLQESPSPGQPKNNSQAASIVEKEKEQESNHPAKAKTVQPVQSAGKNEMHEGAGSSQEKIKGKPVQSAESIKLHAIAANEPQHVAQAAPVPSEQKTEPQMPAPDTNKIYNVSELPLSLQQSLPAFTISAFLYSDDTSGRMVRVNGKMLREGDTLAEGLKLNEIRQNELIFGYHNYRIRLGIK
jgi:general secretion pathway protein B